MRSLSKRLSLYDVSEEEESRDLDEPTGLVVLRPLADDLMPLAPDPGVVKPENSYDPIEPAFVNASPRKRVGNHYITRGIPLEYFPFDFLEEYRYRAANGATVLAESRPPEIR